MVDLSGFIGFIGDILEIFKKNMLRVPVFVEWKWIV